MATYREFDGETDKVKVGSSYMFSSAGDVKVRRETFLPNYQLELSSTTTDVALNYADSPLFGNYDEFMQVDKNERQLWDTKNLITSQKTLRPD